MNVSNAYINVPPGLERNEVEFYLFDGELNCITNGVKSPWFNAPEKYLHILRNDLNNNPSAKSGLIEMGHKTETAQLQQYVFCCYGGFDNKPDFSSDGKIGPVEYVECGYRGTCSQEGKVCSSIKVGDDYLTKQEINILKKIAVGKSNKVIATELFISLDTVSTHNQNIQRKLGVSSKLEMMPWAIERNIVEPK